MNNHHRFRLSDLMPNSWFYKLRDMKRPRPPIQQRSSTARRTSKRSSSSHYYHGTTTPRPLPLSTHQSYSYLQAKQTLRPDELDLSPLHLNSKARNVLFHKDQSAKPRSAAFVVINDQFQELKLRPIRTRPVFTECGSVHHSKTPSSTSPSSPRLRSRRGHIRSSGFRVSSPCTGRRRRTAKRSYPVVLASMDPYRDFRESMVEMIVENNVRGSEALGNLLECYLSLNSREYHGIITEVFRGIWLQVTDGRVEV
jgi:uncharacterized protein (TIGR01568 family)